MFDYFVIESESGLEFVEPIPQHTSTFDIGGGFRIDIVLAGSELSAWIYHKDFGIKEYMFGHSGEITNFYANQHEFMETVFSNATDYIQSYKENYMEEN